MSKTNTVSTFNIWHYLLWSCFAISSLFVLLTFYLYPYYNISFGLDGIINWGNCLSVPLCQRTGYLSNQLGLVSAVTVIVLGVMLFQPALGGAAVREPTSNSTSNKVLSYTAPLLLSVSLMLVGLAYLSYSVWLEQPLSSSFTFVVWVITIVSGMCTLIVYKGSNEQAFFVSSLDIFAIAGLYSVLVGLSLVIDRQWVGLSLVLCGGFLAFVSRYMAIGSLDRERWMDSLIILALSVVSVILGMRHGWNAQFAFWGDEWFFYEAAQGLIHAPENYELFKATDARNYFLAMSSQLQSWTMLLAGETIYGWRLSSYLPLFFSVAAIYYFTHWLAGRPAAIIAAATLASGHLLQSFSVIPYNNTQGLLPLTLGLAFLAYAEKRPNALRYYLLGCALGLSFIVYGVTRLALPAFGLFLLLFHWRDWQRLWLIFYSTGLGFLIVSWPNLINADSWTSLLGATPVESEKATLLSEVIAQLFRNLAVGYQSAIAGFRQTHFIRGAYLDGFTGLLLLVGLSIALISWRQPKWRAWLAASLLFWGMVSGMQQYDYVSLTRTFSVVPVLVIYAGIGGAALIQVLSGLRKHRLASSLIAAGIIISVNFIHINRLSTPSLPINVETAVVAEFIQPLSAFSDPLPIYVVKDDARSFKRQQMLLLTHGAVNEQIRYVTPADLRQIDQICDSERAQVVLLEAKSSATLALQTALENCWANIVIEEIKSAYGETLMLRATPADLRTTLANKGVSASQLREQATPDYYFKAPQDVAISSDGHLILANKLNGEISIIKSADKSVKKWGTRFDQIEAIATIADNRLVVAGATNGLFGIALYDINGTLRRIYQPQADNILQSIAGVDALPDGRLLATDPRGQQIHFFNAELEFVYTLPDSLHWSEPLDIVLEDNTTYWVLDGTNPAWVKVNAEDALLARIPIDGLNKSIRPDIVLLEDGYVAFSDVGSGQLKLFGPDGNFQDILGTVYQPTALAQTEEAFVVADLQRNSIILLEKPELDVLTTDQRDVAATAESWATLPQQSAVTQSTTMGLTVSQIPHASAVAASDFGIVAGTESGGEIFVSEGETLADTNFQTHPALLHPNTVDIAVGPDDTVYMLSSETGQIYQIDLSNGQGQDVLHPSEVLPRSGGLDVAPDGTIWLAATSPGLIVGYDPITGKAATRFDVMVDGVRGQPVDVLVTETGILVTDAHHEQLLLFNFEGVLQQAIDIPGFNSRESSHLARDEAGFIYMTVPEKGSVQQYSADLTETQLWELMSSSGKLARPVGISVHNNVIWISDLNAGEIIALSIATPSNAP